MGRPMLDARYWTACALATLWLPLCPWGGAHAAGAMQTNSRSPYVHRITLYDASGEAISPDDDPVPPYSPKGTCGKCHPYPQISQGWHFSAGDPKAKAGRPGEPWILVDRRTGTQLPLSDRGWPGAHKPAAVGMTPWRFVQRFGRHMPGGGIGERHAEQPLDPKARWAVSGPLGIDCLCCHSGSTRYDMAERGRHVESLNFRWLPVAVSGLAIVRGEAASLPEDYDPDFPDMAGADAKPPKVLYDKTRFDADERVLFDIPMKPPAERCYFCHTIRELDRPTLETWETDANVHVASGLTCVDCHRHGTDHAMARGDRDNGCTARPELSCRGCHLEGDSPLVARFRAPRPRHRGLPRAHLDKIECTTCHAGPRPGSEPGRVQTSRAHGLGLTAKERELAAPPRIVAPVFMRQANGKIAPHRVLWPSFWARLDGGEAAPLAPEAVVGAAGAALPTSAGRGHEAWQALDASTVAAVLEALAKGEGAKGEPVYVCSGKVWRRQPDGTLAASDHAAAGPCAWPLSHDVRRASQALGANGCTDCHAPGSSFFFAAVSAGPSPLAGSRPAGPMHAFMGVDAARLPGWARLARHWAAFVWVVSVASCVLAVALVRYAYIGLAGLGKEVI